MIDYISSTQLIIGNLYHLNDTMTPTEVVAVRSVDKIQGFHIVELPIIVFYLEKISYYSGYYHKFLEKNKVFFIHENWLNEILINEIN